MGLARAVGAFLLFGAVHPGNAASANGHVRHRFAVGQDPGAPAAAADEKRVLKISRTRERAGVKVSETSGSSRDSGSGGGYSIDWQSSMTRPPKKEPGAPPPAPMPAAPAPMEPIGTSAPQAPTIHGGIMTTTLFLLVIALCCVCCIWPLCCAGAACCAAGASGDKDES